MAAKKEYDARLEPLDWRYSAAIVGLVRFMREMEIDFEMGEDFIAYRSEDVLGEAGKKSYLLFAEKHFRNGMHHCVLEDLLAQDELTAEQVKLANKKLAANTVMKDVFPKEKYAPEKRQQLLKRLQDNRLKIIEKTYCNGKSMYANFANTGCLLKSAGEVCRLQGYYLDLPKKKKSAGYNWSYDAFGYTDIPEFDYIPFAFTRSYETFFINNNLSIQQLLQSNDALERLVADHGKATRGALFQALKSSAGYVLYDVEVMVKARDQDYFESLYIRQEALEILRALGGSYQVFTGPCRLSSGGYLDLEKIVTEAVLNGLRLDGTILQLLKDKGHGKQLAAMIKANNLIDGGHEMEDIKMRRAYAAAKEVKRAIMSKNQSNGENKIAGFREKLISALTFNDDEQFKKILLKLSSYTGVSLGFAYDLFEDFEANRNAAFTFVMALETGSDEWEGKDNE